MSFEVYVIGGGAAGFFTAINIAEKKPNCRVTILEKSSKLLGKVKVSGGGRCNVTNARSKPTDLIHFYPRGHKQLHPVFKSFSTNHMTNWLEDRGVPTKTEADLRVFPTSDSSRTIIDCFLKTAANAGVRINKNCALTGLEQTESGWLIQTQQETLQADKVIIATGSSAATWEVLKHIGLSLTPPVPSLFTFNIKDHRLDGLQGVSFESAVVKVVKSKLTDSGPLLITHWGLSGPSILKLSAWGAKELAERNYHFEVLVNFLGSMGSDRVLSQLNTYKRSHPKRKVVNYPLFELPKRFWEQIASYCGISADTPYVETSKKQFNKLTEELTQGRYCVTGKSTFKEEFVTCGGVPLKEIDLQTFECKRYPNLYLAGEVLDIDGLTGGFNFQACWSAGWMISENI